MKKFLLFFTKPIVGGALSLIGLLEILFSIPSSCFTYQIPLWIVVLVVGVIILFGLVDKIQDKTLVKH